MAMKSRHSMITGIVALGALWLTSVVVAQQSPSSDKALPRGDQEFIAKAAEGSRAEVELGRLAQQKAASNAVKQFGQRMVLDHGSAAKELEHLAANKGVKLEAKGVHVPMHDKLAKLQGNEFDREYVQTMVDDHKKDVAEFRKMSRSARDANLKAWIDKTLPTLESHLQTIEGIQEQMASVKK
jgi:putative membrane protein